MPSKEHAKNALVEDLKEIIARVSEEQDNRRIGDIDGLVLASVPTLCTELGITRLPIELTCEDLPDNELRTWIAVTDPREATVKSDIVSSVRRVSGRMRDIHDDISRVKKYTIKYLRRWIRWLENQPTVRIEANVQLDAATEARDKWIYDQCKKGTVFSTIINRLSKRPKSWGRIGSVQGIKDAAKRYANRHNLPLPPRRKRGRPSNTN